MHADGTEVLLEDDFVRLFRPPASTTATKRGPQERLLHVSAAATFRFLVPRRVPWPLGRCLSPIGGNSVSSAEQGKNHSTAAAAAAAASAAAGEEGGREEGEGGAWRSISLGDIASRALALRRQFATHSVAVTAAEAGVAQRRGSVRFIKQSVKVLPALFGSWSGQAMAGAAANAARAASHSTAMTPTPDTATTKTATPTTATTAATTNATASTATTTPTDRWRRQRRRDSPPFDAPIAEAVATAATRAERKTHGFSASVVERAEHGGASFVAFADGRARGAFADRTIVTLTPAPTRCSRPSPHRWEGQSAGGQGRGVGGAGVEAAPSPNYPGVESGYPGCGFPLKGVLSETMEGDREIECVRPDGTVVRLSERSLALAHRCRCGTSVGLGTGGLTSGVAGLGSLPPPHATTQATHVVGSALSRADTTVAMATAARLNSGDADHPLDITPYVAAVRRFAEWALADRDERRARARRGADGKLAAAAEAERNRRFVALQRLMKPTPSRISVDHAAGECAGRSVEGWLSDGARRAGWGGSGEDNKENVDRTKAPAGRGSKGARERNALVNRLLEANREALIGREALQRFGL